MRWFWVAPLLFLPACNSVTPQKVDATISQSIPIICAGIDLAWLGFEAYKADHPVKADLVVKASAAYFAAKNVCAVPPSDGPQALKSIIQASIDFNSVIKAAKVK